MMRAREVQPPGRTGAIESWEVTPGKQTLSERLPASTGWEVIQRQEIDEVETVQALEHALQQIARDARGADEVTLRALVADVERLRERVDATGDAQLLADYLHTQDVLVRAFQARVAGHADATLQAWSGASAEARTAQRARYMNQSGYPNATNAVEDWCGMFANAQFRAAGFAPEFNFAFNHSDNVAEFFRYLATSRSPGTIRPHGQGPEAGVALRSYHAQRGSERSWLQGDAIGDDIRPGDVLTLDWQNDGQADHVCIVASYRRAGRGQPAVLVTIDGNSYGVRKPGEAAPAFDGTDEMAAFEDMTASDVSTSRYERRGNDNDRSAMMPDGNGHHTMTIYGRGRPSLVDFESGHVYPSFTGTDAHPDVPPDGPIQRAGAGAITADPRAAFDAATAGTASELPFRDEMQARFGADFSSVQVYAGRDLSSLGARAATRGEQIAFATTSPDKATVAHELAHVLQSRHGRAGSAAVSDPGDASEHEARAAEAAVAGDAPLAVGAAPTAAIHRQEDATVVPPAVHPEGRGNRQDLPINWDDYRYFISASYRLPVNGTQPGSIREVYEFFLLRYLARELPEQTAAAGPVPAEDISSLAGRGPRHDATVAITAAVHARMQELVAAGNPSAAEALRVRLFASNEHALADALLIPGSTRHAQVRDGDGNITETWCNVFAFDVVTAMGGYLPRQWWTPDAETEIAGGGHPAPTRIAQLRANGLYDWMRRWGVTAFGWTEVATAAEAQAAADRGKIAIILASTGDEAVAGPGHVSVVMARTRDRVPPTPAETGGAAVPLQAQAGGENFATNAANVPATEVGRTGRRAWWADGIYHEHERAGSGFFVYEGTPASPGFGALAVQPPEAVGAVLPAGG